MAMDDDLMQTDCGNLTPMDFMNLLLDDDDPHGAWLHALPDCNAPDLQFCMGCLSCLLVLCVLSHLLAGSSNSNLFRLRRGREISTC